jgi:glycosyltransferase involved in cell wall biosynthesis
MPGQRVLFVVPRLLRAGAETQLVVLANRLSAEVFDKHVLSYRPGDDLKDELDADEVTLHELQRKGRLDFELGRKIGRLIDELEIDVVHCTLQNALLYGYMGIRFARRNPRLIVVIHTTKNANLFLDFADQLVYRPLMKRCDDIWFVSAQQAELWAGKMPFVKDKAVTIHNGIDISYFDPTEFGDAARDLKASLGSSPDEKVLCSIAGFRPEKLHSVLIDAVAGVRDEGLNCRLLLAGAGPLEQELKDQVLNLGLDDAVDFLGTLSDVRTVLAASHCKMLVSAAETFSMAMLEAMAMKTPVITTSVGGASEAIDDGSTGFLVNPDDATALVRTIKLALSNDERLSRMGEAARRTVEESFSVDRMVARSQDRLEKLAAI